MLHFAHLGTRRQQLVEMAAPARRVFAVAIAPHLGEVQNAFDPSAQAEAVSGFVVQIGSSTFSTSAVSIACTGSAPMMGYGICSERRSPLRRVLVVAPSGACVQ